VRWGVRRVAFIAPARGPMLPPMSRYQIHVCDGPSCGVTHGSEVLVERLSAAIAADSDLRGRVGVRCYTCYGRCDDGPNMFVQTLTEDEDGSEEPETHVLETQRGFYPGMDEAKVLRVLREHCGQGTVVEELVDEY
jgi:(2Fe-2S) ferredoxin